MHTTLRMEQALISEAITLDAERVRQSLIENGLENPLNSSILSRDEKYQRIKEAMTEIVDVLGLDLKDDSMAETPHRIAKMYVDEIFAGLDYARFPKNSILDNKMGVDEPVTIDDIGVISTCEHHFVTIDGHAKVAYLPGKKIIGLSKINRIVRFFAQRPQVQERLTRQVLVSLQTLLETDNVAVSIDAVHYCVKARGVMDAQSHTLTKALGGRFRTDSQMRKEFLA